MVIVHYGPESEEYKNFEVVAREFEDYFFVRTEDISFYKKYKP